MSESPLAGQASKLREQAESNQREAARLLAVANVPAFAALPVKLAYTSNREVVLCLEVETRAEAVAIFEELAAKVQPLPVVACRGTFATVKPACDYVARDGEILLDAEFALPLAYDVSGFDSRCEETLRAWFETPTERVCLRLKVTRGGSSVWLKRSESHARDGAAKGTPLYWQWNGLPACNTSFAFASGSRSSANNWTFAFDTSTDLAAWLAANSARSVNA